MTDTTLRAAVGSAPIPTVNSGVRAAIAANLGNLLEIYDFIAFGIFAVPISKAFFAANSEFSALMLTFLTFGAGFLARPAGALVLGAYADRKGRKNALSLTILLMALGTAIIAFCPTYASIGVAAPVIVVIGRLLQGFSAGGEIGGAVATLVENAPAGRRGFYASSQQMSQGCGILLAGLVGLVLTQSFSQAQIMDGAWRLAFVVGLLIAPIGFYIRSRVAETPEFLSEASKRAAKPALLPLLVTYRVELLLGVGVMVLWTIATYISNYFTTYAVRELHLTLAQSYVGQISAGSALLVFSPLAGRWGDANGRVRYMLIGAVGLAVLAYPAFYLLNAAPAVSTLCAVQVGLALFLALYAGNACAVLADLFPTAIRVTGVSVAYAAGVTIFGGFTPALVTLLLKSTGDKLSVAYYLIAAAAISLVPLLWLHRRSVAPVARE